MGCATCTGNTLNDCQSCNNLTNITGNFTYYKVINQSVCSFNCPQGQFISPSILYQCQACAPQCQACEIQADRCILINGCNTGFYFYVPTNSCLAVCPDGYYADIFTGNCTKCSGGCLTCYGGTTDLCNTCGVDPNNSTNTRFKKILIPSCVVDCPDGQY